MADTKITSLVEDTAPAGADWLTTVDTSDTSMASSGTNKKVKIDTVLAKTVRLDVNGQAKITNVNATTIPFVVQGAASQAVPLTEWRDSTGTPVATVTQSGRALVRGIQIAPGSIVGQYLQCTDSIGNAIWAPGSRNLFSAYANNSVTNSAAELPMVAGGLGSLTIPAGALNQIGKTLRLTANGLYSTAGTGPNQTIWLRVGGIIVAVSAVSTLTASLTNRRWSLECLMTVSVAGAAGRFDSSGLITRFTSATASVPAELGGTGTGIDLTVDQPFAATVQFNAASTSNTWTTVNFAIELLN